MTDPLPHCTAGVLVADDDAAMCQVVCDALQQRLGCAVESCRDGKGALAQLGERGYDVFITDMVMPGLGGLPLITAAKQAHPDTDIIVLTGHSHDFPFFEVVDAGATDIIIKPFSVNELTAKTARILRERETRRARVKAEQKFQSVFQLSVDPMLLLDRHGFAALEVNDAFVRLAGLPREAVLFKAFTSFLRKADQERFARGIEICGGRGTFGDMTLIAGNEKEYYLDISLTLLSVAGEDLIFLALKDVTAKREVERQLAEAALTDRLTGLYNKLAFTRHLDALLRPGERQDGAITLLMIDLDNFKACNDSYGHQAGDKLLATVGRIIREHVRTAAGDNGYRYGGDEFAVILANTGQQSGGTVAERIRETFAKSNNFGTSMSIGVVEYEAPASAEAFIKAADEALYGAKARGKNTICVA